jgi:hypothetical protein
MKFGKSKCSLWLTDEHLLDTVHSSSWFRAYIQRLARDTNLRNPTDGHDERVMTLQNFANVSFH